MSRKPDADFEYDHVEYHEHQQSGFEIPPGMMFWQVLGGAAGAAFLTLLVTYVWFMIANATTDCGIGASSSSSILNQLGISLRCRDSLRGWPELVLGNGSLLIGSVLGVVVIGRLFGHSTSKFKTLMITGVILLVVQLGGRAVIFPRDMMTGLGFGGIDWELIRGLGLMGLSGTFAFFMGRR